MNRRAFSLGHGYRRSRAVTFGMIMVLSMALLPLIPAQPVAAAAGPMQISKFLCPDGFNAAAAALGELSANCTEAGENITFALEPDGQAADEEVTDNSGVTFWLSVEAGTGTITEQDALLVGSRVFCSVYPSGGVPGIYSEFLSAGNSIDYSLADNQAIQCVWYDYTFAIAIQGSQIILQKWLCPDGYDAEVAADLDELSANCTETGNGFPFAIVPDGGDPIELLTGGTGYVESEEFPFGTGYLTETAAENNTSRVFCSYFDLDEIGLANYQEVDATGNAINYDLASGEGWSCEWFNIPIPVETSDIFNYKRVCPEGDWAETDLNTLSIECTDSQADVYFSVGSASYFNEDFTDNTGFVGWSVPSGETYFVAEGTPDGYGSARVFCSYYDQNVGPGEYTEVPAPGNAIETVLEPGFSIECYWFNLPAKFGTITVDKFECPEGYATGTSYEQLSAFCTTIVPGVSFTLSPATEPELELQTDGAGQIIFADVPLGEGTLDENVPEQYNFVEVYCKISDDLNEGEYEKQTISSQNVMPYLMEPTQIWVCSWFNLQTDAGPASLTINKYTCQSAHDPIEPNQTLLNECDEPTEDITFTLEDEDENTLSASTGEGGHPATIKFEELEPGVYLLTEEMPADVRLAYISACESDVDSLIYPFYPFAVIEPEGRIYVELLPGENLECDWYNILQELPGTVTVVKYWCEGNVVNPNSCDIYTGGVGFTLLAIDAEDDISFVTGEDGKATVEAEGTFELIEEDFEWCFAQSDSADEDGNIVVGPGDQVVVEIYNCGPQPLPAS